MKTSVKTILFIVFFIAVAGIGAAIYMYNLKPANLKNANAEFTVSASEIQAAFENDEAGSTAKYVGKVIEVKGEISSVIKGENDILTVALKTGNDISFIICTFAELKYPLNLNVGEIITVRGKCSGMLMDVLMNDCVLVTE